MPLFCHKCQQNLVCGIGGGLRKGFAIEMAAVLTPGVVGSWGQAGRDLVVEGFGIGDLGLAGGLVVDRVG